MGWGAQFIALAVLKAGEEEKGLEESCAYCTIMSMTISVNNLSTTLKLCVQVTYNLMPVNQNQVHLLCPRINI